MCIYVKKSLLHCVFLDQGNCFYMPAFHLHAFTNNVFQLAEISQVVQSTCEQYLLQFYTYNNTSCIYIYIYIIIYIIYIIYNIWISTKTKALKTKWAYVTKAFHRSQFDIKTLNIIKYGPSYIYRYNFFMCASIINK